MTRTDTADMLSFAIKPNDVDGDGLRTRFAHVRDVSRRLAEPLAPEDMVAQSMPDASPAKWHLAHTAWFFETFFLLPRGQAPFDPAFQYLFNSYYEALGDRQPRAARGLVTRPGAAEVMAYRDHVDQAMDALLAAGALEAGDAALVTLGLAHEEQHQELLLTDVLHLFAQNPLKPAYAPRPDGASPFQASGPPPLSFSAFEGGVVEVGHDGHGFAFDNEGPRHKVLLRDYELADRLVTNAGRSGDFLDSWALEPQPGPGGAVAQMFGDVWEWTASAYLAYPGFKTAPGAVGEYNGKFMINQMVLRGGSCVTPAGHVRPSYRNFFQPHQRWQFSGLRLARD